MFQLKIAGRCVSVLTGLLLFVVSASAAFVFATTVAWAHEGHADKSSKPGVSQQSSRAATDINPATDASLVYAESATEMFEAVLSLQGTHLLIWLDDYASGKPLQGARVDVEFQGKTLRATPKEQAGEYRIDDAQWVAALKSASQENLLLTVSAGDDVDMLTLSWAGRQATENGSAVREHEHVVLGHVNMRFSAVLLLIGAAIGWFASRLRTHRSDIRTVAGLIAISLVCASAMSTTVWAGPGAHGPNGEHLDEAIQGSSDRPALMADGTVWLPKRSAHLMEVRTTIVRSGDFARRITLNGQVKASPDSAGLVQAPFPGRVMSVGKGFPALGQRVRKGDILLSLQPLTNSFAMSQAAAQLSDVKARLEAARRRAARLESVEGIVSQREVDEARAERDSLEGRLKALTRSVSEETVLAAPMDGIVSALPVIAGQVVDTSATLIEVLDPGRLQFEARLSDLSLLGRIQGARLKEWPDAHLRYLGSGRRWEDGSVPVRFTIAHREAQLPDIAVGQPVSLFIELNEFSKGFELPSAALVAAREGGNAVWVKTAPQRYRLQAVQTRVLDGQRVLVTNGLEPGSRVVVSGAQLLSGIR